MNSEDFVRLEGGYGWIIIASCTLINSSVQPLLQCFALIFETTFQKLRVSAAEISFLLHLHSSLTCCVGFLSAPLFKKYNYQQLAFVACLLISTGIFLTSFVHTFESLIVTVCIIIGSGQGILMPAISLATNAYFKKKLTLAMSYSITGVGLLPIFAPAICNTLLNIYGTSGTILLLAGFSINGFIGVLLLRPVKKLKSHNASLCIVKKSETEDSSVIKDGENQEMIAYPDTDKEKYNKLYSSKLRTKIDMISNLFDLQLFKDKEFVAVIIGMGVSYAAELNFILMTPFVLYEMSKFDRPDVALAMSIQSASDITGRLAIPALAHNFNWHPKLMYAITLIGLSLGRSILAVFSDTRNVVLAASALWGFSKGAKAVFQSIILPKYVSYEKIASAYGVLMVVNGSISLVIGPIIGWIHDITSSYVVPLHVTSALSLACVIYWAVLYFYSMKKRNKNNNEIYV